MNKFLTLAATSLAALQMQVVAQETRPNIIYIMSDDHALQAISAYGSRLAKVLPTPNLDRIANEGIRMDNCCVTNSISAPSRACIMTGQYSHKNGVYTLDDGLLPTHDNFAKEMQKGGYQTAIIGKWHLKYEPAGFDYYNVLPGQGRYKNPVLISKEERKGNTCPFDKTPGKIYQGHSTNVIASQAINWMKEHKDDNQPFMLMCHFKAPHRSWEYAERFSDLLKDVEIPEPENMFDTYEGRAYYTKLQTMSLEDMNEKDMKCELPANLSRDEFRKWAYQRYMKDYLRCIAGIDENVGRILKFLDENGLAQNTVIVYTSDQGFYLGEHGWFDKRYMQKESLNMPLLIRYPNEIKPGSTNKSIIINADFAPTLLDYAGISKPSYMQGESFRSILKNGKEPKGWRDAMYYRYWMHGDQHHHTVAHYGICTERYKLIYYYGKTLNKKGTHEMPYTPDWELFDMKRDPQEMKNYYNDKHYQKVIAKLKEKLYQLKSAYEDNE